MPATGRGACNHCIPSRARPAFDTKPKPGGVCTPPETFCVGGDVGARKMLRRGGCPVAP